MPIAPPLSALPGVSVTSNVTFANIFLDGLPTYKPAGGIIDGTKTRDVGNSADGTHILRSGLIMVYNTTAKKWSNWYIGKTSGAITGASTSLTIGTAEATELNRRIGATGTFVLTGPAAASGTARQSTITYSAINTTTGVVTITAPGTAQVDQFQFGTAATGGNIQLTVQKPDGTFATTANAAWSATDATYISNLNTQLDTTTGVAGSIVASAIPATDTDFGFRLTYATASYPSGATAAQVAVLPTSATAPVYTRITAAVSGAFIAGSVLSESGYAAPSTVVNDPPIPVPTLSAGVYGDVDWPKIPDSGRINVANILNYPTDTGLQAWLKTSMSTLTGGKFIFSDDSSGL